MQRKKTLAMKREARLPSYHRDRRLHNNIPKCYKENPAQENKNRAWPGRMSESATQSLDEGTLEEREEPAAEETGPSVWGHLKNLGGYAHHDLTSKDRTAENFNEVVVGRSETCDVVVDFDRRISGRHCRIYCRQASRKNQGPEDFDVYIENLSSNGTYIASAANPAAPIALSKEQPTRKLNSGDMILLLR